MAVKKVTRSEVDFSDVFHFAGKSPWNIGWNECNDLFFNGILDYESYNDFHLSDLEHDLLSYGDDETEEREYKSKKIMAAFMRKHKVEEVRVYND